MLFNILYLTVNLWLYYWVWTFLIFLDWCISFVLLSCCFFAYLNLDDFLTSVHTFNMWSIFSFCHIHDTCVLIWLSFNFVYVILIYRCFKFLYNHLIKLSFLDLFYDSFIEKVLPGPGALVRGGPTERSWSGRPGPTCPPSVPSRSCPPWCPRQPLDHWGSSPTQRPLDQEQDGSSPPPFWGSYLTCQKLTHPGKCMRLHGCLLWGQCHMLMKMWIKETYWQKLSP